MQILAKGAVAAVGVVPAAPELVAVAHAPVGGALRVAVVRMGGRGLGDPRCRHRLLARPDAALQVHLAKAGDVLELDMEPGAAEVDAARVALPGGVLDPQRVKEAGAKVGEQRLARQLRDDGREHVGGGGVVDKPRAGLPFDREAQKRPRPVGFGIVLGRQVAAAPEDALRRVLLVPRIHGQQVPHAHRLQVGAGVGGRVGGEELEHGVVDREPPLGHGQADGSGGKALAQRVHGVRGLRSVGRPPALGGHLPMAQQHKALHCIEGVRVLLQCRNERRYCRRGDPHCRRRTALQLCSVCHAVDLSIDGCRGGMSPIMLLFDSFAVQYNPTGWNARTTMRDDLMLTPLSGTGPW